MKKTHYYIFFFLILLGVLVLIDIFTGIWYWNRLNLEFSDTVFNNIFTPINSIISTILYGLALFLTIRQNKTINSYNIKDSFLKDINKLRKEAENFKVELKGKYKTDFLEFEHVIMEIFNELESNKEYLKDTKELNSPIPDEKFKQKSYFPQMLFLMNFFNRHTHHNHYSNLKQIIEEVISSDMIINHKRKILNEIENELLRDYLFLSSMIDYSVSIIEFPILIPRLDIKDFKYQWIKIKETGFIDFYNWYNEKKKNAYA